VKELPAALDGLVRREAIILKAARSAGFDIEKLTKATADAANSH
jgi:hypothetical protein